MPPPYTGSSGRPYVSIDDNNIDIVRVIDNTGAINLLPIDNTTGYVTAYITVVGSTPTTPTISSERDDNSVPIMRAKFGGTTKPLLIDSSNGGIVAVV